MAPTPPHSSSIGYAQRNLFSAERSRYDPISCALKPNTVQSATGLSTILARPLTRMSSEKRCCLEAQKTNKAYRDLQGLLLNQIQQEYAKTPRAEHQGKCVYPNNPNTPHTTLTAEGAFLSDHASVQ
jgi:hypothetical protein